ncbi:MAG: ABC transporter ATP-binding protein [Jatrophihabitans sp.]
MTGRHRAAAETTADVEAEGRNAGLSATGVSFRRGGRNILDGVSLKVEPGTSLAVTGPSGSGKSSLLALLAGLETPDEGTVRREPPDAVLGLVLQAYGLVGLLTGAENVEIALQRRLRDGRLDRAEIRRRATEALDTVGLSAVADHLVEELSGGQQQRVAIARALAVRPGIVLADEFTAELDDVSRAHAVQVVLDVARRGGIVVVATHDPQIAAACDHVLHLVDGVAHDER